MSDQNNHTGRGDQPRLRLTGGDVPIEPDLPPQTHHNRAMLAHELSNLLDGSLRNVSLVLRRINDTADAGDLSDPQTIARLSDAATSMEDMAALLKCWMNNDGRDPLIGITDHTQRLDQAIEHALRSVRPVAREQRIDLQVQLPHHLADLPAGPLQPVIINGLRNALEAIERDGQVVLSVEKDTDGWVTLSIADDGPGIDDNLPRDRDGLVLPGVSTKNNGHGLGLTISRDVVRAIGGVIRLENRQDGGAELLIRIPPHKPGVLR